MIHEHSWKAKSQPFMLTPDMKSVLVKWLYDQCECGAMAAGRSVHV